MRQRVQRKDCHSRGFPITMQVRQLKSLVLAWTEAVVFAVHCCGIEWLTAIKSATDIRAGAVIVFWFHDQGPSDVNLPDDDQRKLCFASSASRTNQSPASVSETNRREAVAGHGTERGHRVERAVDLWFIAVLCCCGPTPRFSRRRRPAVNPETAATAARL